MTGALDGLRILGFCDWFTEESSGGVEKVTAEVYRHLMDRGVAIRVITTAPGTPEGETTVNGIPVTVVKGWDLSKSIGAQLAVSPGLWRAARVALTHFRPDVLHASGLHFQSSLAAGLLARRRSHPLVSSAHLGSIEFLPRLTRLATAGYERTAGRIVLGSSRRVIAVSQAVADHIAALGVDQQVITVVRNGVDHDRFHPGTHAGGAVMVVFVGRLIQNKGPDKVLRAFAGAGPMDATLTFVGDGPMRRDLEEMAGALGVANRVDFVGQVNDVERFLASADVLVRSSLTEGQSLAILEAMASGVAVIASDIPPNRELLDDGKLGILIAAGDESGLSEAIRSLIVDSGLRAQLAKAARERSRHFTWEQCAGETGQVLADAAGRKEPL